MIDEIIAHSERRDEKRGVGANVRFVAWVPYEEKERLSAQAAIGVITYLPGANNVSCLPNKLFDYLHAELPMVVSDVKAMAEFIRQLYVEMANGYIVTRGGRDGDATVYFRTAVPAGRHRVVVRMGDQPGGGFDYTKAATIDFAPGAAWVIDFRPSEGGFVFRG